MNAADTRKVYLATARRHVRSARNAMVLAWAVETDPAARRHWSDHALSELAVAHILREVVRAYPVAPRAEVARA